MPVTLDIVMFGGSGAGKTTVLAQMMRTVKSELRVAGMGLSAEQLTSELFAKARVKLAEMVEQIHAGNTGYGTGIPRTQSKVRSYLLGITQDGVNAAAVSFVDYDGEHLGKLASEEENEDVQQVKRHLMAADAVLVAVNTPVLMQAVEPGADPEWWELHDTTNHVQTLANLFAGMGARLPRVVLFCPVKCEYWLNRDPSGKELLAAIQEGYKLALEAIRAKAPELSMAMIPVQTCGSIEFSKFNVLAPPGAPFTRDNVIEEFVPVPGTDGLRPSLTDQPLRHVLWAALACIDNLILSNEYAQAADDSASFWDALRKYGKAGINLLSDSVKSSSWIPYRSLVGSWLDDLGGLTAYRKAAGIIAGKIKNDAPIHRIPR
jgi:hypothetical protein